MRYLGMANLIVLYPCRLFPTQEWSFLLSLYPLASNYGGSMTLHLFYPVSQLLAVDAFSYYRLFLLSPPLSKFDGQSLLEGIPGWVLGVLSTPHQGGRTWFILDWVIILAVAISSLPPLAVLANARLDFRTYMNGKLSLVED